MSDLQAVAGGESCPPTRQIKVKGLSEREIGGSSIVCAAFSNCLLTVKLSVDTDMFFFAQDCFT
jgi:uncharacterized protein YsxB (DUF464 family)